MSLQPGTKLSHYRIDGKIGQGGMGEVWRATDTTLDRPVALKILPEIFSEDPERQARFDREAKLLASLNHPNIAVIHGLHRADGVTFLAMELMEGEDLARRLQRGALAVEEAIAIGRQVADALEAAHQSGVIHRDLKPANIQITAEGKVKVLDFGLAKAFETESMSGSPSLSPTITAAATRAGVILGTAAYMSPEQARGRSADKRADIWAFGCVLYEMLTGKNAFMGETISDTLAAVLKSEPDWSILPKETPGPLRRLLLRCLVKDPRERLRDIGDARLELAEAASVTPEAAEASAVGKRRFWGWAGICGGVLAGALATFAALRLLAPGAPLQVMRTSVVLPQRTTLDTDNASIALSPDGTRFVYAGRERGGPFRLWVRPLDSLTGQPLAGTEGASYPFWSPDGGYLGFFAERKLKKIPASGGAVQSICEAEEGRGASWGADGIIVFAPRPLSGLFKVPASGGTSVPVTTVTEERITHRNPRFLPDGKRLLFFSGQSSRDPGNGVYRLDLATKRTELVIPAESEGIYVEPGYLVFVRDGNLVAQRIDLSTLRTSGEAMPIAENVQFNTFRRTGTYTFSRTGLLLYQSGAILGEDQLTWYDLEGKRLGIVGEPAIHWLSMGISPDGRRAIATVRHPDGGSDLWMYDLTRRVGSRFTQGETNAVAPLWSPDGREVVYIDGSNTLYMKAADGASAPRRVFTVGGGGLYPTGWAPDGSRIAYFFQSAKTADDLWTLPMTGEPNPSLFLATPANETYPSFSPDGRWISYRSDESGRNELYVASYPTPGGKYQISTEGAELGGWLGDGREIWYTDPAGKTFAVPFTPKGAGVEVGTARPLFGGQALESVTGAFTPDGKRFLAAVPVESNAGPALTLVTHWASELEKR